MLLAPIDSQLLSGRQASDPDREQLAEAISSAKAAEVVSLHPAIADAYRTAVENITQHLDGDNESARTARSALRTLMDAVILTPKGNGRGLDMDLEGRLENIVSLAPGERPREREGML
jgi:site-specific DNA recombinase